MKLTTANILDVSSNNEVFDWKKVKDSGINDVIIRLSLGYGDTDIKARQYALGARKENISVSYYHFAYPDEKQGGSIQKDAEAEAGYFVKHFISQGFPQPKWLFVDLETWDPSDLDTPLGKNDYNNWVIYFLYQVENLSKKSCYIYSNKPYLDSHLPKNHKLGEISLWIANYNQVTSPPLPIGWNNYFMWQYTKTKKINGIKGDCDLSRSYQSLYLEALYKRLPKGKSLSR